MNIRTCVIRNAQSLQQAIGAILLASVRSEPGAAHNEGRVILLGDLDGLLAALMCELDRWVEL